MGKTTMTLSLTTGVLSFPIANGSVSDAASLITEWRASFARTEKIYGEAYTRIWNAFHDANNFSESIIALRQTRSRIDYHVAYAYGMGDVNLTCAFTERNEGVRYTISEPARREILDRLLDLNHQRYEEEARRGLHDKKVGKAARGKRNQDLTLSTPRMFD